MNIKCYIIGKGSLLIKSAEMLLANNHEILGILSDDKDVISWADKNNVDYLQYESYIEIKEYLLKNEFDYLFSIVNNVFIKDDILELPKRVAINFHDSPLPKYAGANATSWAIIEDQKEHAITWHKIDNQYDAGAILKQIKFSISKEDTVFSLNAKCFEKAIEGFKELLSDIESDNICEIAQDLRHRSYISRINNTDLKQDYMWNVGLLSKEMTTENIESLIKALDYKTYDNQLAKVKFILNEKIYMINKIIILNEEAAKEAGQVVEILGDKIKIATKNKNIIIDEIRDINNVKINISELILNNKITVNTNLFLDKNALQNIKEFDKKVCKFEDFWVNQFLSFDNSDIPYISTNKIEDKRIKVVKLDDRIINNLSNRYKDVNEIILTTFLMYIRKLYKKDHISIGYKSKELNIKDEVKNIYSSIVPFNIDITENNIFSNVAKESEILIKEMVKNRTYSKDMFLRYKDIKSKNIKYNICYTETDICDLSDSVREILNNKDKNLITLIDSEKILSGEVELQIINDENNISAILKCSDKVSYENIKQITKQIEYLLSNIDNNYTIKELSLISEAERKKIINIWNNTDADYEKDKGYIDLFENVVRKFPDKIAIKKDNESLTFFELNKKANQLANYLIKEGIKKEDCVGILFNKSINMLVSLLAVLKTGAVYIPIDKKYPIERIKYIIQDSNLKIMITNNKLDTEYDDLLNKIIILDDVEEQLEEETSEDLKVDIKTDDLAYIIYTSGSTGRPKGVLVSHRGLNNLKVAQKELFNLNENDNILQFSSFSFDASIWEISLAINVGATIVLGEENDILPGKGLVKFINNNKITAISMPPSAFSMISEDEELKYVHTIIVGSEACWMELIKKWRNKVRIFNGYGPTEATVCVSFKEYLGDEEICTIGTPITNTQIYILDENLEPIPIGIPGEIYIGGAGVAKGYLNKEELTNEKFVPNKFTNTGLMYRSGDVAKYTETGDIEFVGRIDNQIKVRGYRIELEEIENVALENKNIKKVVCLLQEDDGDKKVILYYITNKKIEAKELRTFMEAKLPNYMIPAYFVKVDEFPSMPNGKVNKNELLKIDIFKDDNKKNIVPRNNMEEILSILWSKALKRKNINITDDFFEIGGHSLLAIKIITNLNEEQNLEIPISTMFEHPTIQELAKYIQDAKKNEFKPLIKLQLNGNKRPIFAVHPGDGNVFCYTDLVRELGRDQPFYGFQAYGVEKGTVAKNSFFEMAKIYIQEIKEVQPEGPYIIFGYCAGGTIAFEMARQLIENGEKVEKLVLFDARAPHTYSPMDEVQNFMAFARNFEGISDADLFKRYTEKMNVENTDEQIYNCLKKQTLDERFELLWICSQELNILPKEVNVDYLNRLFNVWQGLSDMMTYKVKPIKCPITLFRAKDDKINIQLNLKHMGWDRSRDDLEVIEVAGNHFTILKYPNVIELAKEVEKLFEKEK